MATVRTEMIVFAVQIGWGITVTKVCAIDY